MNKLYMIVPAYNEEQNIKNFVDDWYPIIEKSTIDSRLVIIDDGSKDDTLKILQECANNHPKLVPLSKSNGGHGQTLLFGYNYAIENGADYVFQTDSDGQTNPDEFALFWDKREKYDAIIGNRVKRGDGISRKIVEDTVCALLRLIFGVKVPDANAPFRLIKTSLIDKYIDRLPKDFNIPNIMFTTYFKYYDENILFLPVTFKPRQGGKNSINIIKIGKIGLKAIKDFIVLRQDMDF